MQAKWYGVIGLGRMGGALVRNLLKAGGHAVVYDVNPNNISEMEAEGATGARDLASLVSLLPESPKVVWMMVPAGDPVDKVIAELKPHLKPGDVVIDGGNSNYRDSLRRAAELEAVGINYVDCGSSGGLEGALNGLCLMVGGKREAVELCEPLFLAISQPGGYAHVGPSGAGHYVKMVHNGIEYGILQAIGEGFELLDAGPFDLDLAQVSELWNHGSVVRSWLMELAARAFKNDPHLEAITGEVGGGSTGSWAIEEAWKVGVPLPVIAMSYALRLRSRQADTMSGKVVAALRREFGGHAVQSK
ncbi:MAG TPA: decarboxylating 6-phosphogluconate dehydrogenase [Symbiobacteriaceae bacterium]|nr:decarboxylating 6-phosphogluconate dehydrogenase [Symbiobacteriaceae bacterium]